MKINLCKICMTIIVALSIGLGGCATMPRPQMSAAETQLEQQSSWFSHSEVQGALFGAALGGGICALAGGNAAQCIASAVGGGVLGYSAGAYMNSLRANYSTQEDMMAKALSDIQLDNQRIANYLSTQQQVIREKIAHLDVIKQGLQQKNMSVNKVQSELNMMRETQANLTNKVNDLVKVQKKWEETYAMINVQDLAIEREIETIQNQIKTIKNDNMFFEGQINDINITTVN